MRVQSRINHVETNPNIMARSLTNPYLPQISHRSTSARLKSNYFPVNCNGCCVWTAVPKSNNHTMSWQRTCPNLSYKILINKISFTDLTTAHTWLACQKNENHKYRICSARITIFFIFYFLGLNCSARTWPNNLVTMCENRYSRKLRL